MKKSIIMAALASLGAASAASAAMCKMPTCKEPAANRSQFCERHTCATKGCNAGVKIGGVPGWAQLRSQGGFAEGGAGGDNAGITKIVWRHCQKHACGRFMPRLGNPNVGSLLKNKTQDDALEILACGNERLFKSKYCLRHSCGVASCSSAVLEEWSDRVKKNAENSPEPSDLNTLEFCPRHLSLKGNNKQEREGPTKETCSENYDRKIAEKQEKLEKQKAAREAAKEKEAAKKTAQENEAEE